MITVEASGGGKTHTVSLTLIVKENTQLTSSATTTANMQTDKTTESSLFTLLSNTTNLMLIIILILAIALIAVLSRRDRGKTQDRTYAPTRYCQECGKPSKIGTPFCPSCGKRFD